MGCCSIGDSAAEWPLKLFNPYIIMSLIRMELYTVNPEEVLEGMPDSRLIPSLTCKICLMLLVDPMECEVCENSFCSMCIGSWQKRKKLECPFRCRLKLRKSHKVIREMLGQIVVQCKNFSFGCT